VRWWLRASGTRRCSEAEKAAADGVYSGSRQHASLTLEVIILGAREVGAADV
jgi:hypothetical protein